MIVIVTALSAKLFVNVVVKIFNAPSSRISKALSFDEGNVFDFLRLGESPERWHRPEVPIRVIPTQVKIPPFKFPIIAKKIQKKKMAPADVKKQLAETEAKALKDKKLEDDKKEQERRKQRRKDLENLANNNAIPDNVSLQNPVLAQSNNNNGNNIPGIGSALAPAAPLVSPSPNSSANPANPAVPALNAAGGATNLAAITNSLVNNPDPATMKAFVAMLRAGKITEAQFYNVLDLMQKSPIVEARQLAVIAAGQMPRAASFELLSQETLTEKDPTVQGLVTQALQAYQNISQLNILSTELSQGSIAGKTEAAVTINNMVTGFISAKNAPANALSLLRPLIVLLNPLTQNANATLQSDAQAAINSINTLPTVVAGLS